jgi:hypothetical protein
MRQIYVDEAGIAKEDQALAAAQLPPAWAVEIPPP